MQELEMKDVHPLNIQIFQRLPRGIYGDPFLTSIVHGLPKRGYKKRRLLRITLDEHKDLDYDHGSGKYFIAEDYTNGRHGGYVRAWYFYEYSWGTGGDIFTEHHSSDIKELLANKQGKIDIEKILYEDFKEFLIKSSRRKFRSRLIKL